jgi:acyl carrier protein
MTPEELRRLRTVTAEVMGVEVDELEADTDFFEDLNADHDSLPDLFVALEDAFGIELEHGLTEVRTVQDLENLVEDEIG